MTGTELFGDMEETLSPKERWMRDNAVKAWVTAPDGEDFKHKASSGRHEATGRSRDEALAKLAQILWAKENIRLWDMD